MGGSSSRRSRHRRGSKRDRRDTVPRRYRSSSRSPPDRNPAVAPSPPSYSVEENSEGEWVNARLDVKWPQPVSSNGENKHRFLALADADSDRLQSERRSRKEQSKREKKRREERKKKQRDSKKSTRTPASRSPLAEDKDPQYITLSLGASETDDSSERSKSVRRERKRMTVQSSPQHSRHSYNSGLTDDDAKNVDSVVFDTRSEMMRYKKSGDILPTRRSNRKKTAAELRENEEYNRYYVGVKSRRSAEGVLTRPGEFVLYYERPGPDELPITVPLNVAYLSSRSEPYHFPIQCFEGPDGHKHYVVMQKKSDGKMFTSILSLIKHYSLYSHVDTATGRLETFSVPH